MQQRRHFSEKGSDRIWLLAAVALVAAKVHAFPVQLPVVPEVAALWPEDVAPDEALAALERALLQLVPVLDFGVQQRSFSRPSIRAADDSISLEQWLRSLLIVIPPIDGTGDSYEVRLHGGICAGLDLEGIDTQKDGSKLRVAAYGISAGCRLGLKFTYIMNVPFLPDIRATLDANITFNVSDSKIEGALELKDDGGSPPLPVALLAPADDCKGAFTITNLQLSGNFLATIVNQASGIIESLLTSQLPGIACTQISQAAEGIGAETVVNASKAVREFLRRDRKSVV